MAATVNNSRSREEVIAWWQRAKKRKAAWEEKMQGMCYVLHRYKI